MRGTGLWFLMYKQTIKTEINHLNSFKSQQVKLCQKITVKQTETGKLKVKLFASD